MSADDTPDDADEPVELDDADLASLLAEHHLDENVERTAELVARFYARLREHIGIGVTTDGDLHDPALELTREWMTYTMGDL